MKFVFIISSLLTAAIAQQTTLSCNFYQSSFFGLYGCFLTINNPNGFNNFTEIGGIHLEGYANADVAFLDGFNGVSLNIPSIICGTFPNLIRIDIYNIGLTELSDSSFDGCSQIRELVLYTNKISSISTNAFVNHRSLYYIHLEDNLLTTLPENVFASQENLQVLYLSRNPFENIPDNIFRPLAQLQNLVLNDVNIRSINNKWFVNNTRLEQIHLADNQIEDLPQNLFAFSNFYNIILRNNRLKAIRRNSFGMLANLGRLDLDGNIVNAIDRAFIDDAVNLDAFYFSRNACADFYNGNNFIITRPQYLPILEPCFSNARYVGNRYKY